MIKFVQALVEELSGASYKNRFALITFSTNVRLVFSFGRYRELRVINHVLSHTRYTPGSTNTAGGLATALDIFKPQYGARNDAEDIVILITDGESNMHKEDTIPNAAALKEMGARILALGIGLSDYSEISQIASEETDVFRVDTFSELSSIKSSILSRSCDSRRRSTNET